MRHVTCAIALTLSVASVHADPANVAGTWNFVVELPQGTGTPVVEFKQERGTLTGTYKGRYGTFPLEGSVKEKAIAFQVTMNVEGETVVAVYAGSINEDGTMAGTVSFGDAVDGTWTATRAEKK